MASKLIVAGTTITLLMQIVASDSQGESEENSSARFYHQTGATLRESHNTEEALSPDQIVKNKIGARCGSNLLSQVFFGTRERSPRKKYQ